MTGGGGSSSAQDHPLEYFGASLIAASINYPLWRVSAVGQSGFVIAHSHVNMQAPAIIRPYLYALQPPFKGMVATVGGMTWARAAIFYASDVGRDWIRTTLDAQNVRGVEVESLATIAPPLVISTLVQIVNQPLVRATITLQDPDQNKLVNVRHAIQHIYRSHGLAGLWHGTSAGILKTVPKYCTAVIVKDVMQEWLSEPDPTSRYYEQDKLKKSALKSVAAGVAGAVLTNPLDVIRNEMFKTHLGLRETVRVLYKNIGVSFIWRGMGKNTVAVAIPVACTIFLTDAFIAMSTSQ
jgi:hypothetical protein